MSTFQNQLKQRALDAQRQANAAIQKQRRDLAKAEQAKRIRLEQMKVGPDGLSNAMRASLQAAYQAQSEDPQVVAIIEQAEQARRLAELHKQLRLDQVNPVPQYEMGRPTPTPNQVSILNQPTPTAPVVKTVAEQLAETRKPKAVKKKPVPNDQDS